ncbi:MAG TPA: MFS transporter [Tepidisphaeraceae bacterium]|jgi:ACS family glucarate transporter-like MFS transporter|nr:MFS transporter [Tepidisphaeraceae bacterium]
MIDSTNADVDSAATPLVIDRSVVNHPSRPTSIRHAVVGVTAFAAFLMYLDRMCLSQMVSSHTFQLDLGLSDESKARVLGVFFLAYALAQMPAGWLADRFSTRRLMTCLISVWSLFTLSTGFATGFWTLIVARVGCGIAEAGAYPLSGKMVPRWFPTLSWGRANAIVSAGGRFGGAAAPLLTALAIVYLGTWRTPGWIFGGVGVAFAGIFWAVFRDKPADHPWCNQAEVDLIEGESNADPEPRNLNRRAAIPWVGLLTSRDMWLMCCYQWLTNVGWAFLVTLLPTYLITVTKMSEVKAGRMTTIALLCGIIGMLIGGWLTDMLTRRFGVRRGRMIPMVWSRLIGAAAYLLVLRFNSPWACVAAFGVVAAMTDLSIPPVWGYIQDVGGRNVAATFAWPNMWGNLGAATNATMLVWINNHFDPNHNWHASLIFLAGAFLLSGVMAMGIRADVKIEQTPDS